MQQQGQPYQGQNDDDIVARDRDNEASNIPPHPEGQFPAVMIDLIDHGDVQVQFQGRVQMKHKVTFRFYAGETFDGDDGVTRLLWVDHRMTLSLSQKSTMRPFIESWRGKKFTDEEAKGFLPKVLLHKPCLIQVVHNPTEQRTWANIASIMKLPKGMVAPEIPADYVRVKDRPPREPQQQGRPQQRQQAPQAARGSQKPLDEPDDDLPFR